MDWPVWCSSQSRHGCYKMYVKKSLVDACIPEWKSSVARHLLPIPYLSIAVAPHNSVFEARGFKLSWNTLTGHLHLCRLRCGMMRLGHLNGRGSGAKVQQCILCNKRYTAVFSHVITSCSSLASERSSWQAALDRAVCAQDLTCGPDETGFVEAVVFASEVARESHAFWSKQTA